MNAAIHQDNSTHITFNRTKDQSVKRPNNGVSNKHIHSMFGYLVIWSESSSDRQIIRVLKVLYFELLPAVGCFCITNGSLLTSSFNHNRKPYAIHIEYRRPGSDALLCALLCTIDSKFTTPIQLLYFIIC